MLKGLLAVLLLLGLSFTGFGIYFIALGNEAAHWPEVEGRVLSVSVRTDFLEPPSRLQSREARERTRRYYPRITYSWQVDGTSHTGSRYRLGTTHEKYQDRAKAQAAAATFRSGAPIPVFYDATNPAEAVLVREASAGVFVPLPLGLLFSAMGWFGLRHVDALRRAAKSGTGEPLGLS